MKKNHNVGRSTLAIFLFLIVFGGCKETNITEIIQPGNEDPGNDSLYTTTGWIVEARALNYLGFMKPDDLYPSYFLQAGGLCQMYAGSPFAREMITGDIFVRIKNPGVGTRVTLAMTESEINEEFSSTILVGEESRGIDTLTLRFPVDWKQRVLCHWRVDRLVDLRWDLLFNDRPVETYKRTFYCHSINAVAFSYSFTEAENPEKYAYFKQFDFGDFPYAMSGDTLSIHLGSLIAGYIDENSPFIEQMKREVIEDGYASLIFGGATSEEEEWVNAVKYFNYLMQKYGVTYGIRNANIMQYVRGIDEVFANRNGFCTELSAALVSWYMNLGIKSWLFCVPGHVYPIVRKLDGDDYPWDPNLLCYAVDLYPDLGELTEEKREIVDYLFDNVVEFSREDFERDIENEARSPLRYQRVDVTTLRYYLPSFNASEEYWSTSLSRSAGERRVKIVKCPRWFEHEEEIVSPPRGVK